MPENQIQKQSFPGQNYLTQKKIEVDMNRQIAKEPIKMVLMLLSDNPQKAGIFVKDEKTGVAVGLPRSQITYDPIIGHSNRIAVVMPRWLAEDRKLISPQKAH